MLPHLFLSPHSLSLMSPSIDLLSVSNGSNTRAHTHSQKKRHTKIENTKEVKVDTTLVFKAAIGHILKVSMTSGTLPFPPITAL